MLKYYLERVEKEIGKILKCLIYDRGGYFTSNEFENFYNDRGIKRQTYAPMTPPQNGIIEKRNIYVMDCATTLMMEKIFSLKQWREIVSTIVYTLNQVQVNKGKNSTLFELWYVYSPNIKYFKVFGRKCYILKENRNGKLDAKSEEGIFLGYSTRSKSYKCLNTNTKKVVESPNVKFDEYIEVHEDETKKEPKNYRIFMYYYEELFF